MAVIPKKAATVILYRNKGTQGFEIFLLKRHQKSSFMGGSFVYPGGKVDDRDCSSEMSSYCRGITPHEAQKMFGVTVSPAESLAHWIAGIRELFEESGVLLAYDSQGNLFHPKNPDEQRKLSNYRESLCKREGGMTIWQVAQEEHLLLALDQLHYYAHWITPEAQSERFDARFFLGRSPSGWQAIHDQRETIAGVWMTPREALEENLKGKVPLSPPTLKTLEDLSRFQSIDDVLLSLKKREIHPILPILTKISELTLIIFPGDPEYDLFYRGEVLSPIQHGYPSRPSDNTTRLILKEGTWLPYCLS